MFGVVLRNFVVARHPFLKRVSGAYKARVFATGTISSFFATNMPNPLTTLGPKLMIGVVSRNFVVARHPFRKRVSGCISTSFYHRNHFFVFRNEHAQFTTLGPKLMFEVVSRNLVVARHPFQKRVSGCIKHEFLPPEPFLRFSERTCPIH
jgi:hypothetical protein